MLCHQVKFLMHEQMERKKRCYHSPHLALRKMDKAGDRTYENNCKKRIEETKMFPFVGRVKIT